MIQDSYCIGANSLYRTVEDEPDITKDPRGFLHVWEEPKQHARYIMSCDPTVGITGWSRFSRKDGDEKTDNAAIEIIRVDARRVPLFTREGKPDIDPHSKVQRTYFQDVQVAEFFAPIDAVEAARICALLGRIYVGDAEEYCELIFESYPGPGILTLQELLRLGYSNLWQWELIGDGPAEATNHIGWRSWRESQRLLWQRARRHLMEDRFLVHSPWLLNEYSNAVVDPEKMRARASYGAHDDLIQAASMGLWAGHRWTYDIERTWEPVTDSPILEPQKFAPTLGENVNWRDHWSNVVDSWE